MTTTSGSGGAKTIPVAPGDKLIVNNFGAFGTGDTPAAPGALDTLHFLGAIMTPGNMVMTQSGTNVVITFDGLADTQVTLRGVSIAQLENIAGAGNFIFSGEAAVTDSVDVWSAAKSNGTVEHSGTATFLNELDNKVSGLDEPTAGDTINGQGGDDILSGLGGNDTLRGGQGNDRLDGGAGADRMIGGNGNDTYIVDDTGDVVVETNGTGGVDTVLSGASFTLGQNLENLTLTGHGAASGVGNGLANVMLGNDAGNALYGGGGDDDLRGNAGDDTLSGVTGNDKLDGGVGNDWLDGGTGADAMNGGRGDDTYIVDNAGDAVIETVRNSSGGGIDMVQSAFSYTLGANLDNLALTGSAVSGTGNALDNGITGNDLANVLDGGGGNDRLDGGIGKDTLKGGAGDDRYIVNNPGDVVIETLSNASGGGVNTVFTAVSYTLGANLDDLFVNPFVNADGTGNDLANTLFASDGGVNTLRGGGGNDTIIGGTGDTLLGESGNDTFRIGQANIKLADGGIGLDTVNLNALGPTIDLTGALGGALKGMEVIDLGGFVKNTATLNLAAVDALTATSDPWIGAHTLLVKGDVGDAIQLNDKWTVQGSATIADPSGVGATYVKYTNGDASLFIESDLSVAISGSTPPDLSKLDGTNGFTISAPNISAAGAGDLNGDGYSDMVVGTSGQGNVAYVVYGHGAPFPADINPISTPGSSVLSAGAGGKNVEGFSVAAAGDVNGDGYDDAIIGVPFYSNAFPNVFMGSAFVVFGGAGGLGATLDLPSLNGSNGFQLTGLPSTFIGWSVASAGDVNGDGYDDILVGSSDGNTAGKGLAYLVFGHGGAFAADLTPADLAGGKGVVITGGTAGEMAGHSIASAGDINGDGYDDFILGGRGPSSNTSGESFVVFGHAGSFADTLNVDTLNGTNGFKLGPVPVTDATGMVVQGSTNVASAGDLNGDGYADLVVGVYAADPGGKTNAGSTYVVFGQAGGFGASVDLTTLDAAHGFRIDGAADKDSSGWSVAGAGDVNGDGYADLLVSAHLITTAGGGSGANPGHAYVVFGHAGGFGDHIDLSSLTGNTGFLLTAPGGSTGFGMTVAPAGDVNGDGFADIAISDYNAGKTYVVFGADFLSSVQHAGDAGSNTLTGSAAAESFVGGDSRDYIYGNGGKDAIQGGGGSDLIHVKFSNQDGESYTDINGNGIYDQGEPYQDINANGVRDLPGSGPAIFGHVDGGAGYDFLFFDSAGALDLGNLDNNAATSDRGKIANVEVLDFNNGLANDITLHKADVLDMNPSDFHFPSVPDPAPVLRINGDGSDTLHLAAADGWSNSGTDTGGFTVYASDAVKIAIDPAIHVTVS